MKYESLFMVKDARCALHVIGLRLWESKIVGKNGA